jgi:hypothetical protein
MTAGAMDADSAANGLMLNMVFFSSPFPREF